MYGGQNIIHMQGDENLKNYVFANQLFHQLKICIRPVLHPQRCNSLAHPHIPLHQHKWLKQKTFSDNQKFK